MHITGLASVRPHVFATSPWAALGMWLFAGLEEDSHALQVLGGMGSEGKSEFSVILC